MAGGGTVERWHEELRRAGTHSRSGEGCKGGEEEASGGVHVPYGWNPVWHRPQLHRGAPDPQESTGEKTIVPTQKLINVFLN